MGYIEFLFPLLRSKTSGQVCLTYEDCSSKWDNLDRQKATQQQGMTLAMGKAIETKVCKVLLQTPAKTAPVPASKPRNAQKVKGAGKRKRVTGGKGPHCNQYNTPGGCRGTKTATGCSWPDGGVFQHGCSARLADGNFCNSLDHNLLTHPRN